MRILMSAYACCPGEGSEQGIGWNWAIQAARFHDVWVITRKKYREAIEAAKPANLHPVYVDLPRWARFWKRGRWAIWPYYVLWHWYGSNEVRRLHRRIRFDLVHHVSLGSIFTPDCMKRLKLPLIAGPLGGGEAVPVTVLREPLRNLALGALSRRLLPGRIYESADIVLAANRDTFDWLQSRSEGITVQMCSIGWSDDEARRVNIQESRIESRRSILYVGGLVRRKCVDLAIRGFAQATLDKDIELSIVGDGPERKQLESLSRQLGVADRVHFWGKLARQELGSQYGSALAFLFPSARDSAGWVLLEAMSAGLPIICLDVGGPGSIVPAHCGLKIRPQSPEQVVRELARAIEKLVNDARLRLQMGKAGRNHVTESFNWDRKGEQMTRIYEDAIARVRRGHCAASVASVSPCKEIDYERRLRTHA